MNKSFFILIAIIFVSIKKADFCEPPDCDRLDCGSCGNACCDLQYLMRPDPSTINSLLSALLQVGGPDKLYTFVTSEDLRPYNISANFIIQGIHTTLVKRYNDTLNFVVYPIREKSYYQTRIRAFSISQIGGAYCDDGQNYKNLIQFIKGLNLEYIELNVLGCPEVFKP